MSGPRLSESFNCCLKGIGNIAARLALTPCALALLTCGCATVAEPTGGLPPAPTTPGAIATEAWSYDYGGTWNTEQGEWIHLPADEAGELLLWIEHAEGACR